jgi:hypothetical protein
MDSEDNMTLERDEIVALACREALVPEASTGLLLRRLWLSTARRL